MILLYRILTKITFPLLFILIFFRIFLKKEDSFRYKEKIFSSSFNLKKNNNKKLIWFHAASIGELKSILPILSEINKKQKDIEFLVTTITLTSAKGITGATNVLSKNVSFSSSGNNDNGGPPGHTKRIYKVRKGDTLGQIAENFNTRASKIRRWNNMKYGSHIIHPGKKLVIWVK